MNFKSERDEWSYNEATRDPIFLLQIRCLQPIEIPDGYVVSDDGVIEREDLVENDQGELEPTDPDGRPNTLSLEDLLNYEASGGITSCAFVHWSTEAVFYSRKEAEDWAKARHYRWRDGYRIYCVCAEGELADLLKKYDQEKTEKPENRYWLLGEVEEKL